MIKVALSRTILLVILVSMASCVTVTISDVGKLRKGMTMEEANATLPLPPRSTFAVEMNDRNVKVQVCTYRLSSGDYSSDYFLAFRDEKLIYWGYPHEFARSTDPIINEIGEKAVAIQAQLDGEGKQQREQELQKPHR